MTAFNKNAWYRQLVGVVSPRAFTIGYVLVEHYLFRDKDECWSSQENLGRLANASSRTVRDALKELEDAGFLTHRRGGKGHANRYIPHFVDRQNLAGQNRSQKVHDRQDFACDDRQDPAAEYTEQQLKAGGPLTGTPHEAPAFTSDVVREGSKTSPPDAPVGAVGAVLDPTRVDVDKISDPTSSVRAPASGFEKRIAKLDEKLDALRDFDTGEYPRLPVSVRIFNDRGFYGEDEFHDEDVLAEIERDLASFVAGTWHDEDENEDDLGAWDRADADADEDEDEDEDDEANSLIAAAPTRR